MAAIFERKSMESKYKFEPELKSFKKSTNGWTCGRCTLINTMATPLCICGSTRPTIWKCPCGAINNSLLNTTNHKCYKCHSLNDDIEHKKTTRNDDGSWNCPNKGCNNRNPWNAVACSKCRDDRIIIDPIPPEFQEMFNELAAVPSFSPRHHVHLDNHRDFDNHDLDWDVNTDKHNNVYTNNNNTNDITRKFDIRGKVQKREKVLRECRKCKKILSTAGVYCMKCRPMTNDSLSSISYATISNDKEIPASHNQPDEKDEYSSSNSSKPSDLKSESKYDESKFDNFDNTIEVWTCANCHQTDNSDPYRCKTCLLAHPKHKNNQWWCSNCSIFNSTAISSCTGCMTKRSSSGDRTKFKPIYILLDNDCTRIGTSMNNIVIVKNDSNDIDYINKIQEEIIRISDLFEDGSDWNIITFVAFSFDLFKKFKSRILTKYIVKNNLINSGITVFGGEIGFSKILSGEYSEYDST